MTLSEIAEKLGCTLAGDDPRIDFLGAITDSELVEEYANALAVPFVPYDEDLGLITIEAMTRKIPDGPEKSIYNNVRRQVASKAGSFLCDLP